MLPVASRRRWAMLVPLAVATGTLEAGAAASVLALVQVVADPSRVSALGLASRLGTMFGASGPSGIILTFTALVMTYQIAKNLALIAAQYARYRVVAESRAALSVTMLRGYLAAPYTFHLRRNSADLLRNATRLPQVVCGEVLSSVAALMSEALVATGIAVVLVWAAPGVTLIAGAATIALVVVMLRLTRLLAARLGGRMHALHRQIDREVQTSIGGVKEIKVLEREAFFGESFREEQGALIDLGILGTTLSAVPPLVVETSFVLGALLVVALVSVTGNAGPNGLPLLGLFSYAGFRIVPALNRITFRVNEIRANAAAVRDLYEDFTDVAPLAGADPPAIDRTRPNTDWQSIALDRVTFRYAGADRDTIDGVSFDVRRGEVVGIVGPTGAGKTTMADLVLGLLPPSSGRVLLDDADITPSHRPRAAYVQQTVFVADDTLARNIAFGIRDTGIVPASIERAIRMADLDSLVRSLAAGVETLVGERGSRLSGGERQRVGIARALYHEPDLLVLDEATSALDVVTEDRVLQAIRAMRNAAVVLIAHRPSTLRHCDRLVLLMNGRVAASGTFDQLLASSAEFRELADAAAPMV